jgi:hypothetical protein
MPTRADQVDQQAANGLDSQLECLLAVARRFGRKLAAQKPEDDHGNEGDEEEHHRSGSESADWPSARY